MLLLDEPLSNLDAKLREDARAWVRELIKQTGTSALYVTHDQTEALAIADRVLLLDRGRIQQEGTPQEIYGNPASQFSAEFMGSNNLLQGKITEINGDRARLEGEGWSLWGKLRGAASVGATATGLVRVEHVRLTESAGDNHIKMTLRSALYLGERWEYQLQLAGLRVRVWGEGTRAAGEYWVSVPADGLWIF